MNMDFLLSLFVIVVFSQPSLAISSHLRPRLNNATDQHALLQFKANLVDGPYNSLQGWTPNISFCHWTGVSCSRRRQRAISLNLTEYGLGGRVSTKGDVYSFGVLLLEMVTRKRPTHDMFVDGLTQQNWVSRAFPNGVIEVVDGSLLTYPNNDGVNQSDLPDCLIQLIHVALLCTKESLRERPTIIDVVRKLDKIRDSYGGIILESMAPLERLAMQLRAKVVRTEVVSFELDRSSPMSSKGPIKIASILKYQGLCGRNQIPCPLLLLLIIFITAFITSHFMYANLARGTHPIMLYSIFDYVAM